uniref:Lipopolysaccharide biosynthesis protein n=1 Tax=Heterorhabditis bacteriophora TaxID=37862 RepID=A0A1I7WC41_HETBA
MKSSLVIFGILRYAKLMSHIYFTHWFNASVPGFEWMMRSTAAGRRSIDVKSGGFDKSIIDPYRKLTN